MLIKAASRTPFRYRELRIEVVKGDSPSGFRVRMTGPDRLVVESTFINPIGPRELDSALASIPASANMTLQRSIPYQTLDPVKDIGSRLFGALFEGRPGRLYTDVLGTGDDGVRLRLVTEDDEVASLPWELLYDVFRDDFLVLSTRSPLVRQVPGPLGGSLPPISGPVRVLFVAADVTGYMQADRELELMQKAADRSGMIQIDPVVDATLSQVTEALRGGPYHVLHFTGTGVDQGERASFRQALALLEGAPPWPEGTTRPYVLVEADHLESMLSAQTDLRLVVLNGCRTDWLAARLTRWAPATVGHRAEITDAAALAFAEGFYSALLDGQPLEAAVTGGRLTIDSAGPGGREWSAPVFHLQASDGTFLPEPEAAASAEGPGASWTAPPPVEVGPDPERERTWRTMQAILGVHQQNLELLKGQQAQLGDAAPQYLLDQVVSEGKEVERLRAEIEATYHSSVSR